MAGFFNTFKVTAIYVGEFLGVFIVLTLPLWIVLWVALFSSDPPSPLDD